MPINKAIIVGPRKSDEDSFGGIQTVMNAYEANTQCFLDNGIMPLFQESLVNIKGKRIEIRNKTDLIRSLGSSRFIASVVAQTDATSVLVNSSRGFSLFRELRTIRQIQKKRPVRSFLYLHHANKLEKYLTGNHVIDREIVEGLKNVDHLILLSKKTRDLFIRSKIVDREHSSVLYPFHSFDSSWRFLNNRDTNIARIIYMGHLYKQKGVIDLIEAFSDLPKNYFLDICGDGDPEIREYVVRRAEKSNRRIVYHGVVRGSKKVELYQQAMLFCLPSYAEGLPISMLEAMSFGCVPVVSNVGAIGEVIDQSNGIMVNPGDRQGIALGIQQAYKNWAIMSEACIRTSSCFSVDGHIERLCKIIDNGL